MAQRHLFYIAGVTSEMVVFTEEPGPDGWAETAWFQVSTMEAARSFVNGWTTGGRRSPSREDEFAGTEIRVRVPGPQVDVARDLRQWPRPVNCRGRRGREAEVSLIGGGNPAVMSRLRLFRRVTRLTVSTSGPGPLSRLFSTLRPSLSSPFGSDDRTDSGLVHRVVEDRAVSGVVGHDPFSGARVTKLFRTTPSSSGPRCRRA